MFDQELDIQIQIMDHDGWTTIFHQDVVFPLKTANVIPFRNTLKKTLEDIIDNAQLRRRINMNTLRQGEKVLKFTYYHRSLTGYRDSITHHIKMTEEGWRSGIAMFAEKIWRN